MKVYACVSKDNFNVSGPPWLHSYECEYQYGEFSFIETCPVYPDYNANNEIILNLNSYGTTIGDYIDIDFGGSYFDYQGNPHTINGVVHVKRDN